MTELAFICSPDEVRSLLRDVDPKTQARRMMVPQPADWVRELGFTACTPPGSISGRGIYVDEHGVNHGPAEKFYPLKHGTPGDRLWVQEEWQTTVTVRSFGCVAYRADGAVHPMLCEDEGEGDPVGVDQRVRWEPTGLARWRAASRMPRWASRITLQIATVRAERLHAISESDARAEGCVGDMPIEQTKHDYGDGYLSARTKFARQWDAMNIKRAGCAWSDNPWVIVTGFERVVTP